MDQDPKETDDIYNWCNCREFNKRTIYKGMCRDKGK